MKRFSSVAMSIVILFMTILVIPTYAENDDVGAEVIAYDRITYFNTDLDTLTLFDGFGELYDEYGLDTDYVSDTHDGVMMRVTRDNGNLEYYSIEYKNEVIFVGLDDDSDRFYGWESIGTYDTTSPTYVYRAVTTNSGISYTFSALTSADYISVDTDATDIDIFHTDYDVYAFIDTTQTMIYDLTATNDEFDSYVAVSHGNSIMLYNSSPDVLTVTVKIGDDSDNYSAYRWRYCDTSANNTSVQYFNLYDYNYHGIQPDDWIIVDNIGAYELDFMFDDVDIIDIPLSINSGDSIYYDNDYLFSIFEIFQGDSDTLYQFCVAFQTIIDYDSVRFHSLTKTEIDLIMVNLDDIAEYFTIDNYIPMLKTTINDMLGLMTDGDDVVNNPIKTLTLNVGDHVQFYNDNALLSENITITPLTTASSIIVYQDSISSDKIFVDLTTSAIYEIPKAFRPISVAENWVSVIDSYGNDGVLIEYDSTKLIAVINTNELTTVGYTGEDFLSLDEFEDLNKPIRSNYDDGWQGTMHYSVDKILYFVFYPVALIGYALSSVVSKISLFIGQFNDTLLLIGSLFSWLPLEIQGITILGISVIVLVGIIQMIRK